jgi:hypothetical protein
MSYRPATLSDQIGEGAVDIDGDGDHIRQPFGALSPARSSDERSKMRGSLRRQPRSEFKIVRDCRIVPAIGRRQKISDSSAKGEQFRESTKCGRG